MLSIVEIVYLLLTLLLFIVDIILYLTIIICIIAGIIIFYPSTIIKDFLEY